MDKTRCIHYLSFFFLLLPVAGMGQESGWLEKYEAAVSYFYAEVPDAQTDSSAMHLFQGIIEAQTAETVPDTVLVDAYEKLGTLFLIQNQPEKSIQTLKKGILTARKNNLLDSLLFHSYLFLGENFFLMNQADSSIFYLNRAEAALRTKADKNETGRLYNSLGVIYYESGNFTQAVNYFSKAKSALLEDQSPDNSAGTKYALFSLLSNEAAAWTNLNAFTKAADLYTQALELTIDRDEIMRKLAALYVEKNAPDTALYYLQQTEQQAAAGNRLHQNILADIYLLTNQPDNVIDLLHDAARKEMGPGTNAPTANNYRNGKSFQLLGKAWHQKKQYEKALQSFHLALLSFDENFQQTDVFQNPTPGNVNWGMTDLFETLLLKAETAGLLATETQEVSLHRLSFHTYQTAFDLVFYMNNLYDNEEARIFLGEAVRKGYESAVAAAIDRYKLTNDPNDLIQGFSWAEESKATALELARNEARIKEKAGIPRELLQQEKTLKFQLTRANRQLMENYSPKRADELEAAVRDSKLALSRLYASYNDFTVFFTEKLAAKRIEFSTLQSHVNSNNLAILSYFIAGEDVFCFTLTPEGLKLAESSEKASVTSTIRTLQSTVLNSRGNSRKDLESAATRAFQQVVAGAYTEIADYRDWIILPDQVLVHVPFEMMLDPAGQFLVENHALSYLYSGKFLHAGSEKPAGGQVLGFAPFTGPDSMPHPVFKPLPYSGSEIDALTGLAFTGQSATKTEFLKQSESASLIHLATHAFSSSKPGTDPFIVFSPAETDHLLYAEELYQLNLQNTSLVFLSACQTHTGTLIASEGLISLSRAFSYAGCSNVVSSIWKANDKATAYISQEFYRWVDRGYSFPVSLQRAKKALRNDPEMAQFHHPYYWANLVYIGTSAEPSPVWFRFWYLWLLPAPLILAWWFWKKSPGKPGLFNR